VVFGVNFLNDKVQHTFPAGTFIASTVNFTASAQVRAGVLVTPGLLLFGQTGVSGANQRLQINFGGPVTDVDQFRGGFTAGFGGEWMPRAFSRRARRCSPLTSTPGGTRRGSTCLSPHPPSITPGSARATR
jgi:hypothetical protein